jgi:hypothetical protein
MWERTSIGQEMSRAMRQAGPDTAAPPAIQEPPQTGTDTSGVPPVVCRAPWTVRSPRRRLSPARNARHGLGMVGGAAAGSRGAWRLA